MARNAHRRKDWRETQFELWKQKWGHCLEPNETCKQEPIRAHSIQNSRILDSLCEHGHVVMPNQRHNSDGRPILEFVKIGRNQATTFTGLCAQHDCNIFAPIDKPAAIFVDPAELFLLAYRSVLRETHATCEAACRLQSMYQARIAVGRSSPDEPDSAGMCALDWLCNAHDTYEFKREFDNVYLGGTFEGIVHEQVRFEHCRPSIAVSSVFSLDDMARPDDAARVVLNILPLDGEVRVVFSYLQRDAKVASSYLQRVLSASGDYQMYLVSKLVLQHCENFVVAPSFFNHLSQTGKQRILEFLQATILTNQHDHEDEHLFLF